MKVQVINLINFIKSAGLIINVKATTDNDKY